MSFGLNPSEIDMIESVFREFPVIERVVIFGSRAMGNFKIGSDVDMVLEGKITTDLLARIRMRLNEELPLPYVFDIFDQKAISNKSLKEHIRQFGRVFYSQKKT